MTDIAKLGIEVDPKQLTLAVIQLDKLSVAAAKAQVEAKKLERDEASLALAFAKADKAAAANAASIARTSTTMSAAEKLAAANAVKQASAAVNAAQATDMMAAASLKAAQAALTQSDAAQKLVSSNQAAADSAQNLAAANQTSMRLMGQTAGVQQANMTNIAAQFQDIGVTAAMGMNPMMIGLQQGAQLTGVWGSIAGTTSQKMAAFGSALRATLSPMSLVIIGLTAGVAWLIQWGAEALTASSETARLQKALDSAKLSTSNFANSQSILANVFDLTTGKIKSQTDATMALARAQAMQSKIQAQVRQQEASSQMKKLSAEKWGISGGFGGGLGISKFYGATSGVVDTFRKGEYSATQAMVQLERLVSIGQATKDEYLGAAQAIANFAVETENITNSEKMLNALSGDRSALSGFLTPKTPKAKKGPKPEPTQSEKFAEMMKETRNRIWLLGEEANAIGLVGLAGKEYAFQTELESEARSKGIDLTKENRQAEIDFAAAKLASAAQTKANHEAYQGEIDSIREQTLNLNAQTKTIGMSETATASYMYQRKLLNDEIFRGIVYSDQEKQQLTDAYEQYTQLTEQLKRQREQLEFQKSATRSFLGDLKSGLTQGKSLWESWGNSILNVLNKIVDKMLDDVVNAMFKVNSAGASAGDLLGSIFKTIGGGFNAAAASSGVDSAFNSYVASRTTPFAKGGAFTNSIVSQPTQFFAKGGTPGVMGEAGPEAIMPLQRGPDGSLGVQMYGSASKGGQSAPAVNVNNNYQIEGAISSLDLVAAIRQSSEMTQQQVKRQLQGWLQTIQRDGTIV